MGEASDLGALEEEVDEGEVKECDEHPRHSFEVAPAFVVLQQQVQREIPEEDGPDDASKGMDEQQVAYRYEETVLYDQCQDEYSRTDIREDRKYPQQL